MDWSVSQATAEAGNLDRGKFLAPVCRYMYHIFSLLDWHIVEVEVTGPSKNGKDFSVETVRRNPADPGAVTGSATYASFYSSLLRAMGKGKGMHLC